MTTDDDDDEEEEDLFDRSLAYLFQQEIQSRERTLHSPWVCLVFTGTCWQLDSGHIVYRRYRFSLKNARLRSELKEL
ncbi:uncharacterized, partial [Tachysurus ichikawai]